MTPSEASTWKHLADRIRAGDAAARQEMLTRAYARLRRLAGAMLHRYFPALRDRHDVDSAVNEAWIRLTQALAAQVPPTPEDFFGLAAHKVRQVLLDMIARQRRLDAREGGHAGSTAPHAGEPADPSHDPSRLASWTEFHDRVTALPDDERRVFEMHYYLDVSQAEIAELLDQHPRKVSRLWVAATERLADLLPSPS